MSLPFVSLVTTHRELGMVVAVLLGFGFGFVLERAGFGRASKLAAQFYGFDMTVFKVMFSAIVTAMLGVVLASELGLVSLEALSEGAVSETYIWPMAIGGFLLGAGFIISGYCPGTSIVATASGNFDGLVTVLGVVVGSVLFGELQPLFADFHVSGAQGQLFLYQLLGLPPALVAAGVAVMALGAFAGAEKLERIFARRLRDAAERGAKTDAARPPRRRIAFTLVGAGAAAVMALLFVPISSAKQARAVERIGVEELARRVFDAPWRLRILDLRDRAACVEQRIPGSDCAPLDSLGDLGLADSAGERALVLVGGGELEQVPEAAARYKGELMLLGGGFAAWRRFALETPEPPAAGASPEELAAYRFRAGINQALTGSSAPPPPPPADTDYAPKKRKKGGGCG